MSLTQTNDSTVVSSSTGQPAGQTSGQKGSHSAAKPKQGDGVKVRILGKEYMVNCSAGEAENLVDAAHYLDSQMRGVQQTGKIFGVDRCAIMAALNISAELLALKKATVDSPVSGEVDLFIDRIQAKLDSVVTAAPAA